MFHVGRRKLFEVFAQRPTGNVRKGWREGLSLNAVVAFSAQIDLAVARKLCWILNARLGSIF
jgi:hypothetical protein